MRQTLLVAVIVVTVGAAFPNAATAEPPQCFPKSVLFPDGVTRLRGDVDGDGRSDLIRTRARWLGDQACRAELVAETARGTLTRRIHALTGLMIAPPGLAGLIDLDRRPGLEIAVVVWLGASTGFLDIYGVHGHELARLNRGAFDYAGSLVNRAGVDCLRNGPALIVDSNATYRLSDDRYHVTRMFLGLRGGVLQPLPRLTEHYRLTFTGLARLPEFASAQPFPSCTVVQGVT